MADWTLEGRNGAKHVDDAVAEKVYIEVDPDAVTLEISGGKVQVKNAGITDAKLRNSAALSVIGRTANSAGVPADIAAGVDGQVLQRAGTALVFGTVVTAGIVDAAATLPKLESRARPALNHLINGGFNFAQRGTAITSVGTDGYAADRWRVMRENTNVDFARTDITTLGPTNVNSRYGGRITKTTSTGKMGMCQIIEHVNTIPLRGKTVVFQARIRAGVGMNVKMAILQVPLGGAVDTVASPMITAWGAGTADPSTYASSVAVITATQQKVLTTTYQNFSMSVTVPVDTKNLVCAIWTESQLVFGATAWFEVAEAGLFDGADTRDWLPIPIDEELMRCQRYYCKTFAIDTAPAQNLANYIGSPVVVASGTAVGNVAITWAFPVRMRTTPATITTYNPYAANSNWDTGGGAGSIAAATAHSCDRSTQVYNTGVAVDQTSYKINLSADAEI